MSDHMGVDGFVLVVGAAAGTVDLAPLLRFARSLTPPPCGSADLRRSGRGWALGAIGDPHRLPVLQQESERCIIASSPQRLAIDDEATATPGWRVAVDEFELPRLSLIGDVTGSAGLCWAESGGCLWVTDRPEWLLAMEGLSLREDELYFAAYYAGFPSPQGRTPLAAVRLLPAASRLGWSSIGIKLVQALMAPDPMVHDSQREQLGRRFRDLLAAAVGAVLPESGPIGVLLSGGFDSAAVLACLRASVGREARIVAVTAGYRWPGIADERKAAEPTAKRFGVEHYLVDSAAHPPDLLRHHDLRGPVGNSFRGLSDAVYSALARAGVLYCMTGQYADELDSGPMNFWQEWRRGLPGATLPVAALLRQPGSVLRVLRQRLRRSDSISGLHLHWCEALSRSRLEEQQRFTAWPRPAQVAWALGSNAIAGASLERRHFRSHGLEAIHPFRYWPLMRFLLSLPAQETRVLRHQKRLQKRAMASDIPEAAASPDKIGSQNPLFMLAFRRNARWIRDEVAAVRPWEAYRVTPLDAERDEVDRAYLLWRALAHLRWRRALSDLRTARSGISEQGGKLSNVAQRM